MWFGWVVAGVLAVVLAVVVAKRNKDDSESVDPSAGEPAIIAHEMRTPLTLIRGAAELLEEETPGPLNETQRNFVATIQDNSSQAIDIAENFIANLKLNSPSGKLVVEEVDVRAVVADAAKQLRKITDLPIYVDARGGILPIWADKGMIRQVVWNLINNSARHAGKDAAITVRIENAEGGGAILSVSDDGAGIALDEQERLFKPFAAGTSRRPGSGIGMMVTKQIVERHGGRIMVDSLPGLGTVIVIALPKGTPDKA